MADLHKSELLLACVVVSGGSLVLLGVVGALLVGVLVSRVNQFPGVLWRSKPIKSTPSTIFNFMTINLCLCASSPLP